MNDDLKNIISRPVSWQKLTIFTLSLSVFVMVAMFSFRPPGVETFAGEVYPMAAMLFGFIFWAYFKPDSGKFPVLQDIGWFLFSPWWLFLFYICFFVTTVIRSTDGDILWVALYILGAHLNLFILLQAYKVQKNTCEN